MDSSENDDYESSEKSLIFLFESIVGLNSLKKKYSWKLIRKKKHIGLNLFGYYIIQLLGFSWKSKKWFVLWIPNIMLLL
jgi:hypothetical protein